MILFVFSIVKNEIITSAKLNKKIFYVQTTSYLIYRFNTNAKISKKLEMSFNKALEDGVKLSKLLIILLLFNVMVFGSSCSTSKKAYRPTKHKKKNCDCSQWSYNSILKGHVISKNMYLC